MNFGNQQFCCGSDHAAKTDMTTLHFATRIRDGHMQVGSILGDRSRNRDDLKGTFDHARFGRVCHAKPRTDQAADAAGNEARAFREVRAEPFDSESKVSAG